MKRLVYRSFFALLGAAIALSSPPAGATGKGRSRRGQAGILFIISAFSMLFPLIIISTSICHSINYRKKFDRYFFMVREKKALNFIMTAATGDILPIGRLKELLNNWNAAGGTASLPFVMIWARYMDLSACPVCHGARLKKESLAVTVAGKNIYELCRMSIRECFTLFEQLNLSPQEKIITERILKEIKSRLNFLLNVGMDYLSLERSTLSLSGGESQRIRLATQIGSGSDGSVIRAR